MREPISAALEKYWDEKLKSNGACAQALAARTPGGARAAGVYVAESSVGIRESGGNNKGPLVELLLRVVDLHGGDAWCMALQQAILAYVEKKTGLTSPVYASGHCQTVWNKTPTIQRVKISPSAGAICIWRHGNTSSGHTGLLIEAPEAGTMRLVEGNTEGGISPTGAVVRNGGGVYLTKRNVKGTGDMVVVGFLKPF